MKAIRLTVDLSAKILDIEGKTMALEGALTDALIGGRDSNEPVLSLEYGGRFPEDDSPIEKEMDKLRVAYGEGLFDRVQVSGSMLDEAHYLSFQGPIEPTIQR